MHTGSTRAHGSDVSDFSQGSISEGPAKKDAVEEVLEVEEGTAQVAAWEAVPSMLSCK